MDYPNSHIKGDYTEMRVASAFRRIGWNVSFPFGTNHKYDLVAEKSGVFYRVQVKASRFDGTSVSFKTYNSANKGRDNKTTYTNRDIDGFATYSAEQEQCYWIPVVDCDVQTVTLNTNDSDAVRPAEDYRLESFFE